MKAPEISESTRQEREQFIYDNFYCRGNCDICGLCQIYHGPPLDLGYEDYIDGKRSFQEISQEYRKSNT